MNPKHHDSLEPNVLEQRIPASQVQKARTRDMERTERDAREALIRTVGDETRLLADSSLKKAPEPFDSSAVYWRCWDSNPGPNVPSYDVYERSH